MKMNDNLQAAFNHQIHEELVSWYVYRHMAAWYTSVNLDGFAHWMQLQAAEEMEHADRLCEYMEKRGNVVSYANLELPNLKLDQAIDGVKASLNHERHISKCIHQLLDETIKHQDHGATIFLQWFVTEQEEEEEQAQKILDKFETFGSDQHNLYHLDKELKKREHD